MLDLDTRIGHDVHLMPPQNVIDNWDQARDGEVSEQIHAWRAEGLSVDEITFRLRQMGMQLTPKTLRRWLNRDGSEPERSAS